MRPRSSAARAPTSSRSNRRRSTRSACSATPRPRHSDSTPATTAAPPSSARQPWRPRATARERYRGEVLPSTGDWAAPHRARLEEARLKLVETRLSARLQLGHDVVGDLEAAVTADAYQEGLWELLITALYRAGRQADALATYQRVRARLADELGLDPGPRLRQLEQRVLNHDPGPRAGRGELPPM